MGLYWSDEQVEIEDIISLLGGVSDCEELVGDTHKKDTFTKDTILIKLNFEKQYFAVKLFI